MTPRLEYGAFFRPSSLRFRHSSSPPAGPLRVTCLSKVLLWIASRLVAPLEVEWEPGARLQGVVPSVAPWLSAAMRCNGIATGKTIIARPRRRNRGMITSDREYGAFLHMPGEVVGSSKGKGGNGEGRIGPAGRREYRTASDVQSRYRRTLVTCRGADRNQRCDVGRRLVPVQAPMVNGATGDADACQIRRHCRKRLDADRPKPFIDQCQTEFIMGPVYRNPSETGRHQILRQW